jgi:hypothetical protein
MNRHPALKLNLPSYSCRPSSCSRAIGQETKRTEPGADPEDYLAEHRWGFLCALLVEGAVDWHGALEECIGWIQRNREKSGDAWEAYSASERVANLLVFLSVMPVAPGEDSQQRLTAFLSDSLAWIYGHIEFYGSAATHNHILNNARALVVGGVATGNAAATAAGMQIFRRCLPSLISETGFLRERSSHYQLVVLNWLLDAQHFLISRHESDDDSDFLRSYIEGMVRAADLLRVTGVASVLIGDVSPDASPALTVARLTLLYPEDWPLRQPTRAPVEVRDDWFRISAGDAVALGNFPRGRFPPTYPTHGHCDQTSFIWLHGGREILADSGRYRYTADAVSLFQTSGSAHNMPIVNGLAPVCETLLTIGQWWPTPYASSRLEVFERDGGIVLRHDGFARATPVTYHSRHIALEPDRLKVVDRFDGDGSVDVMFCWHFGSSFTAFDAARLEAGGSAGRVKLHVEAAPEAAVLSPISSTSLGGWTSRIYGQKEPALSVGLRCRMNLPAAVSTLFQLTAPADGAGPPQ